METQRILNRVFSSSDSKKTVYDKITRAHHDLMKEYGWIHPDEFYSLPMEFVNNMIEHINHDRKEEQKAMKKGKR